MPELPEVETARRGIEPFLLGQRLRGAEVRNRLLRRPVPERLDRILAGNRVEEVGRRGKFLFLRWRRGSLLIHLGMSGSLRVVPDRAPPERHDHLDLLLPRRLRLRFRDPRRFGLVRLAGPKPLAEPPLADLGPEPLAEGFDGVVLRRAFRGRRAPVKVLLLDGRVVAGIGNIYACEALHRAGVRPDRPAGSLAERRCVRLAGAIREVLARAIEAGGTTLRDFRTAGGEAGWFRRELSVYGREGEPCPSCGRRVRNDRLAGRSTFWCSRCQT
ncbi:MAG: bifunctional DNA-formamidopyrimidine glycosylase/DNA-(apurinic or apyrimidinic site) lyase [Planctomycetota bacterium]|nr:MAG: bifunctional DNA-formamidopyrimidine glycosylase/DNA-(apurinic or apyrimidinic site) lyase [Planctomycetota bacterium]